MPLYEISESGLARHERASLGDLGLREREDLRRLIRDDIGVLDDDLLVVAEKFGQWEHLSNTEPGAGLDARAELTTFIDTSGTEEPRIATDVRIIPRRG